MTIESASFIDELVSSYPATGDFVYEGDDHLRLIKAVLLASFPNIDAAMTATSAQLNDITNKITKPGSPSEGDLLQYTGGTWVAAAGNFVPAGAVMPYAGSAAPTGWLFADGSVLDTTAYATLFAAIGYTYGGAGASFNLPDLRGRAAFGKDNMDNTVGTGGGDAARLTSGSAAAVDGDTLGAAGGVEATALTTAQMPVHNHSGTAASAGSHSHSYTNYPSTLTEDGSGGNAREAGVATGATTSAAGSHSHSLSINNAGSGSAHTNLPPALVLNYIIYSG
jgi:microcystin-dependent protein